MASEPTPAVTAGESNGHGVSPLSISDAPIADPVGQPRREVKEVHFSSLPTVPPRAQSLATTVPFLEPISSASSLPKQSSHSKNVAPQVDMNAYIEQSRALLEIQRKNFEHERSTFEAERKLWDAERKMLLSKIADLELKINQKAGSRRRYSNEHPASNIQSFRSDFSLASNFSSTNGSRPGAGKTENQPVWRTPDMGPVVTRVFPPEMDIHKQSQHLPRIAESGISPALDGALSPNSQASNPPPAVSIPIEKLDSRLDGITLKSTGLPPSVVAKVISPNEASPHSLSPGSRTPSGATATQAAGALHIPSPPNLTTNAGHTPLAFDGSMVPSEGPSDLSTPVRPKDPSATEQLGSIRQPTERSDSYFPDVSPSKEDKIDTFGAEEPLASTIEEEDKELKGPLMMESQPEEGKDNAFLSELDAKLLAEAKRIVRPSSVSTDTRPSQDTEVDDLDGPRLRLKKSSNFGSAFGASDCGTLR